MNKTTKALKLAEEALAKYQSVLGLTNNQQDTKALAAIREALADHVEQNLTMVAEHKCGGCAKTAADGYALYCVECWEKANPVKQEEAELSVEPVALHKVVLEHIADLRACVPTLRQYPEMESTCNEVVKAADELESALIAAPVGADHFLKAIAALREGIATCRAEALEEAAKLCDALESLVATINTVGIPNVGARKVLHKACEDALKTVAAIRGLK